MLRKLSSKPDVNGLFSLSALAILFLFVASADAQDSTTKKGAGDCSTCDIAGIDVNAKPTLKIRWKRVVDTSGRTASIHAAAETEIVAAYKSLKTSLEPLGVEVVLQKAEMSQEQFNQNPLNSNRIWLNGKALEMYLPETKTGQIQDANSRVLFRTVSFGGKSFKEVPAKMIEHAGLIAAADSMKQTMADLHAVGLVQSNGKSCCGPSSGGSCCAQGGANSCCKPGAKQPAVEQKKSNNRR